MDPNVRLDVAGAAVRAFVSSATTLRGSCALQLAASGQPTSARG